MSVKEAEGLFCVVGAAVNASQARTWYGHQSEAAQHARDLIGHKNPRSNSQNAKRLYVVKIVEVIEETSPPINNRAVSVSDFADLNVPHATQTE